MVWWSDVDVMWCWAQESFKNECNSWVCLCSVWTGAGECHTEHWQRFPNFGQKTDQVSRSSLITRCEWVSAMWTLHRIVIITMHQPVAAHNARMEPRATTWHTHCNRGWCGGAVTETSYFCTTLGGGHCIVVLHEFQPGARSTTRSITNRMQNCKVCMNMIWWNFAFKCHWKSIRAEPAPGQTRQSRAQWCGVWPCFE